MKDLFKTEKLTKTVLSNNFLSLFSAYFIFLLFFLITRKTNDCEASMCVSSSDEQQHNEEELHLECDSVPEVNALENWEIKQQKLKFNF